MKPICTHFHALKYWTNTGYSKTYAKQPLSKIPQIGFQDQISLIAEGEHFAILSTFIKLPFVIKIFILSIFEWLFYTGFTVYLIPTCPLRGKPLILSAQICTDLMLV